VSVSDKTNSINFVTIYRPPQTPIAQFLDEFENLAGLLASSSSPTLFCGDFNIWVESNSSSSDSFAELLESLDLSQHVDFPTNKFGHTLDLLIAPSCRI
jgi:exonuclease III